MKGPHHPNFNNSSGPGPADTILRIPDVMAYLKISRGTVYRLLRQGKLPGFKIGSDWRFSRKALDRWRREQDGT